jgi:3'-phosphoadenosine 5'-phosphosulfate (PAPS) 3'-phosphatase
VHYRFLAGRSMSMADQEAQTEGERLAGLLHRAVAIARQAGELILEVYDSRVEVRAKADDSPVTQADERAEQLIVAALAGAAHGVPIVAEEAVAAGPHRVSAICSGSSTRSTARRSF